MTQDYADAVAAAQATCLLCGKPCETFEMLGGTIRVCPCVPNPPGMVAVDMSRLATRKERQMKFINGLFAEYAKTDEHQKARRVAFRDALGLRDSDPLRPIHNHDPGDEQDPNVVRQCRSEAVQQSIARRRVP